MAESAANNDDDGPEYAVMRETMSRLIRKILPEEICDGLFEMKIIDDTLYESSFDTREPLKSRARNLILAVLKAVKPDPSVFNKFCTVLEKSKKDSIRKLGSHMIGESNTVSHAAIL